jgi:hypothetical protein
MSTAAPPRRQAENYGFTVFPQPLAQKSGKQLKTTFPGETAGK